MTKDDDALQGAIIDQLNAEITVKGLNMKLVAEAIEKPYDSTRNYLIKERPMPLSIFLEVSAALGVDPATIIARARARLVE